MNDPRPPSGNYPHKARPSAAAPRRGPRPPRAVADLIGPALRALGVPSQRVTEKLRDAWALAADPSWDGQVTLHGIRGGVLEVGVRSAALRNELAGFHCERVLAVMRTALPDLPLVAIRFRPEATDGAA